MLHNRFAIIDIGTNTFHLLIVDIDECGGFTIIKKNREAVRLGLGGIQNKLITDSAIERAISTLSRFKKTGIEQEVADFIIYATSAVRNAENKKIFLTKVRKELNLNINVIDGEREAELIYKGVTLEENVLTRENALIIDIGGGSVEFIIANKYKRLWARSFEIGGLRLKNSFHKQEPIGKNEFQELKSFIAHKLKSLDKVLKDYAPSIMVGCSGTFDTILEIAKYKGLSIYNSFNKKHFESIFKELISKNREERLLIDGMIPLRVDLIVVSCSIIKFLFD